MNTAPPIASVQSVSVPQDALKKGSSFIRRGDVNVLAFDDEDMSWTVEVPPALRKKLSAVCDQIQTLGEALQRMELHVEKKASKLEVTQVLKKKADVENVEGNRILTEQRLSLMESRVSELQDHLARALVDNTRMSSQIEILVRDKAAHDRLIEDRKHELSTLEDTLRILISRTKDELYNNFYKKTSRLDQSIENLEGRVSIQENTLTPFINKHDEQMDALVEKDDCLDEDIKILGDSMRQFEDDVKRGLAGLVMQSKTDMEQQSQYMRSVFNTLQTEINVARQDAARMLAFQDEFQSVVDRLNTVMIDCQHNNEDMEIVRDRVRVVEGNLRETSRNLEVSTEHVNVLLRDKESAIRSWTIDRLTELQSRLSHAARAPPAPSEAPTLASTKAVDIQPPQSSAALDPLIEDARNKELSEMKRAMAKLAADLTKVNDEVFIFARRQDERTQGKVADIKEELVTIASKLDIAYDKAEEAILSIEAIRKAMEEAVPGSTTRGSFMIGAQDLNERPIPPNPESAEHSPNVSSAGRSEARAINTSNDPIIKTIMTATNQHAAILSRMETDISKLQSEFLKEISTRNRTISLSQESLKAFEDALDEEIRNRRINYQEVMRIIEGLIGPDEMQKAVLQSSSNHPINLQFSEMGSRPLRRPGSGHAISPSNLPAATSSTSISEIAPDSHIGISLLQTQTSGNRTGDLENMNDSPLLFPAVELPGSHSQASISASGSASAFAPLSASNSASISAAASAKGPSPPLVLPAVNTPRKVTFQNPASEGLAEAKSIADTKLSSVAMADARSAETERWKVRHNASIPIPTALPESSTTANRDRPSTANTGQTAPSPRKARVEKEATTQLKTARSTPSPASIDPRPPTAPQSRR